MFGKASRVSALAVRKQLLIAESELNRAQLSDAWRDLTAEVSYLTHRAKTIAVWSSSAAMLMAGLAALRNRSVMPAEEKPSWLQRTFEWVRLVNSFWQAIRKSPETAPTRYKHESKLGTRSS